ncbi:unnamed protein product [Paramecium octaurelia]|uniref:Uncharacterized protein n=1 Tax=Paramecium octaurelia TaxID=43137 RepID=A0A8S1X6U0_PAROT|nr:unnamed protein product [Paramecium octaurelia]
MRVGGHYDQNRKFYILLEMLQKEIYTIILQNQDIMEMLYNFHLLESRKLDLQLDLIKQKDP